MNNIDFIWYCQLVELVRTCWAHLHFICPPCMEWLHWRPKVWITCWWKRKFNHFIWKVLVKWVFSLRISSQTRIIHAISNFHLPKILPITSATLSEQLNQRRLSVRDTQPQHPLTEFESSQENCQHPGEWIRRDSSNGKIVCFGTLKREPGSNLSISKAIVSSLLS